MGLECVRLLAHAIGLCGALLCYAAALMMQLGMDGVFVGSGIFKAGDPKKRAHAIVQAVTHYKDAKVLASVSTDIGKAMVGISDIAHDPVNFRDREGGAMKKQKTEHAHGNKGKLQRSRRCLYS